MIHIHHLSKTFGQQDLFKDVSLTIGEKEKIGLIGRNGSGKSTFLKVLLGQEGHDEGKIEIPSRVRIAALEQHMKFTHKTIVEQVCSSLPSNAAGQNWKAESVLMGLGFTAEDFARAPEEFSSGMQVRIRLAQVLVSESQLLLLDEPTNYLDIVSLRWLERFLQNWKGAFILVTHDQQFMEKVVHYTVGIHRGKMRKIKGEPMKLMKQIHKEEEVHENTRVNMEKKAEKTKEFISKFRAGARSAGLVQSRIKSLEKQDIHEKLEKVANISFRFDALEFRANTLLEATNIYFSYTPDTPIIQKASVKVCNKDRVAIIGRNGKGKSTLLQLLVGELQHESGKIKKHPDLQIGYFSAAKTADLHPEHTILSELMLLPDVSEQQVRAVCGALLFTGNNVKKHIANLSGGEKSRVCFAKVLLSPVHLLVLDEPTNHLDMESCQALTHALQEFPGTVLFVTHDERMLSNVAHSLVVFDHDGIQTYHKTYDEFLEEIGWSEEDDLTKPQEVKKESSNKEKYLESKEQQKRLRQVQTLQKRLTKEIEKLEEQQTENATALQKAYEDSNRDRMETLGKEAKQLAEDIAEMYEKLEEVMEEEYRLSDTQTPTTI